MKRKPLLVAAFFLAVVVTISFLVFSGIAVGIFDFLMGNNVYALQVAYVPSLDSFGNAKVSFTVNLIQAKVPIETVLTGYGSHVDAQASFEDSNFSVSIWVYCSVANDISVYAKSMSFQDGQPRTLTCYLKDYDAGKYPVLKASVWGFTVYNDVRTDFSGYGGQWTN